MGFFHFLSDRDRNENNPSRSRTDDHPPQASILDRYPDCQSCLQTIALLCSQERTLRISVDSKLSLPFGGLPVDRKQSIRTLDSFKTLIALLRTGEKIVIFPEGTYFRQGVGLGKSRLLQMILRFQQNWDIQFPLFLLGYAMERGQVGEDGWRSVLVPLSLQRRSRTPSPDASSDGRDQPPMSLPRCEP